MSAEEALDYIRTRPEGVLQSDLWKALEIDSRKCSRIVAKLLKENLVTREVESVDGIRTYRLYYVEKCRGRRFESLLAMDSFEPCAGCIEECAPEHCAKLSEWIFAILIGVEGGAAEEDESASYPERYGES